MPNEAQPAHAFPNPDSLVKRLERILCAKSAIITQASTDPTQIRRTQAAAREAFKRQVHSWFAKCQPALGTGAELQGAYKAKVMAVLIARLKRRQDVNFTIFEHGLQPTADAFDYLVGTTRYIARQ